MNTILPNWVCANEWNCLIGRCWRPARLPSRPSVQVDRIARSLPVSRRSPSPAARWKMLSTWALRDARLRPRPSFLPEVKLAVQPVPSSHFTNRQHCAPSLTSLNKTKKSFLDIYWQIWKPKRIWLEIIVCMGVVGGKQTKTVTGSWKDVKTQAKRNRLRG